MSTSLQGAEQRISEKKRLTDQGGPQEAPGSFANRSVVAEEALGHCTLCGSTERVDVASGYDYESLTCGNRWRVRCCSECQHWQLDPRPALSTLSTIYPATYYSYQMEQTVSPVAMWAKTWLDRRKLRKALAFQNDLPDGYLDVGCGDGRYLRILEAAGVPRARLFGMELDDAAVDRLRERGYQAWNCRAEEVALHLPTGSLDLVTMFHVIEHVSDPRTVIERLSALLRPGGALVVETPNIDSVDCRLFRRTFWGGYHFPRHWHFFSTESLARLLEQCGLEVCLTRYQTGHAFWLYSFHHWLRFRSGVKLPWLASAVHPLRHLLPLALVTVLDFIRAGLGQRTSAVLMVARKRANP